MLSFIPSMTKEVGINQDALKLAAVVSNHLRIRQHVDATAVADNPRIGWPRIRNTSQHSNSPAFLPLKTCAQKKKKAERRQCERVSRGSTVIDLKTTEDDRFYGYSARRRRALHEYFHPWLPKWRRDTIAHPPVTNAHRTHHGCCLQP